MPSPGAILVLVLALRVAQPQNAPARPALGLPCCFASAQNATSLGPVVVLRRDDENPSAPGAAESTTPDPTWEATLRRAATRALTWEGLGDAPFVDAAHSAEVLAQLNEASDIRVLARGLLVAAPDGRPVFREVDLPGERCLPCPVDQPGPNGESIKAMWSVRRIRHSGPNADHRPCYELQFSVTPIVTALPPLSRWMDDGVLGKAVDVPNWQAGLHAGLRAESRVSRQGGRELRPKGLILRVNPAPAAVGTNVGTSSAGTTGADVAVALLRSTTTLGTPTVTPRPTVASTRVHEHLHHHFYVRDGVTMYAGSTTETEFPTAATQAFRPSPQYHEYSQPDPLFHPRPAPALHPLGLALPALPARPPLTAPVGMRTPHSVQTAYPNSINEQLPPAGGGTDTRVPYVSATKHTAVPVTTITPRPPTTLRFPADIDEGPTVTILPSRGTSTQTTAAVEHTQVYRVKGAYTIATPTASHTHTRRPGKGYTKRPAKNGIKGASKGLSAYKTNYYEVGRPSKEYPTSTDADPADQADKGDSSANPTRPTLTSSRSPPATSTARPEATSEFLSEYPAATVRGTTPALSTSTTPGRVQLFTPHYGEKDYEMSILKVMTSKVPSYIDIFTDNGVRVTTTRPEHAEEDATSALSSGTRLFNPYGGPYSLINSSRAEVQSATNQPSKLSTTLQTRRPQSTETVTPSGTPRRKPHTTAADSSTSSSPLQITFFVASEDEARQPSASTLVSSPFRQDDATTYQYTILHSVKQSIDVMRHENETNDDGPGTSTEPMSFTRRVFTNKDEHTNGDEEFSNILGHGPTASLPDLLVQSVVNGHTNHRNVKVKNNTENFSQILKNLSLTTEPTTTRRPWRPSTRRPWRQRSSYKQFYSQRKRLNHTTPVSLIEPTSVVEIRKTYSVTASRKRKPLLSYQGNSNHQRAQKLLKRRNHTELARSEVLSSDSEVQHEK